HQAHARRHCAIKRILTFKLGLLGHPVSHSLSPPMHEAALRFFGLEGTYTLLDVAPEKLAQRVGQLVAQGYTGFNVTIPHKDAMFQMAAERTQEAELAQAANTILVRDDGTLLAHNTDIGGLRLALEQHNVPPPGNEPVLVIGAGGAAGAALVALAQMGYKPNLLARNPEQSSKLASQIGARLSLPEDLIQLFVPLDGTFKMFPPFGTAINCTPIGQKIAVLPDWAEHVFRERSAKQELFFFDMVYSRDGKPTPLVALARSHGWRAVDGTDMLVHQARMAFEFWTGKLPPYEVMKDALERSRSA
ncbi:MAG: shikimate dehydrogenase family protein, partial [Terriglobales bacterium]